ncbi:phage tail protein [Pseudomonas sp. N2-11]|uniref:phage tail-collar fiber domain-containing protein n=1 Tax=Pseudomonas sp. N2-11 TaxID=2962038 RepID=UPI0020B82F46|nr:phage tail protein [Pseudomonas sp. N2-11]MCP3789458.1 phage tail protein [Pseudomonas sp. N2-11]
MGASITLAGESLIAQKQGAQQKLEVARFVLANVPGLDVSGAVNRAGTKPPAAQIVHTASVTRRGYVSPRQVIYSLMIPSDVGDWDFNWIGLETTEGVLLAVAYVPLQQKRRNIPPTQIGNNITRNFLVEFSGAQQLTGITVDASTWQHDFTVRLTGIDERERLSNRDVYGRACFFQDGLQLERNDFGLFQLKSGTAYVEGIRVALAAASIVQLPALPASAWLDVCLTHEGSEVLAGWTVVFGSAKADYLDTNSRWHYLVKLADIAADGAITDLRAWQPISSALIDHFAARNGDYEHLRARATTKEDVGLDQIPNAISDDPTTNSSEILATTKALRALMDSLDESLVGMVAFFDMEAPPPGWIRANGASLSRAKYPRLYSRLGTRHGSDSPLTFNVPEVRAEYIRALDDGRGVDPGRVLGSWAASQNLLHEHEAIIGKSGEHSHVLDLKIDRGPGDDGNAVWGDEPYYGEGVVSTRADGEHDHPITIKPSGGNEARPRSIAFLACIKY